jgi:hypothetical protein
MRGSMFTMLGTTLNESDASDAEYDRAMACGVVHGTHDQPLTRTRRRDGGGFRRTICIANSNKAAPLEDS